MTEAEIRAAEQHLSQLTSFVAALEDVLVAIGDDLSRLPDDLADMLDRGVSHEEIRTRFVGCINMRLADLKRVTQSAATGTRQ